MASIDVDSWQTAILEVWQSHQEVVPCTVYDMSNIPPERQPVRRKWVFKVTHNAD